MAAPSAAGLVALVLGDRQATGKTVSTIKGRRPVESKAALLLLAPLLLLALAAAPAAAQSPPTCPDVPSFNLKTSSETASLYSSPVPADAYGTCGRCNFGVYASADMTRDQPGKPTATSSVELWVSCFDVCGGYLAFFAEYSTSDTTGVDISKSLKSASVTSSLTLLGYFGPQVPPSTASVSVRASANGQIANACNCKSSSTYSQATPCGTIVSSHTTNNGGYVYQSASFTGSITLGETTYAVQDEPSFFSRLSKSDNIQRTMVKNRY